MPNANPAVIANPKRLAALRQLCLLDTPADPAFDRLTRLAARFLNVPTALVSLVDDHRQFLKSQIGLAEPWASRREMPLDYSYCQHVVAASAPLIIGDARQHPLVFDNRSTLELGIVAYAGMPLITSDGDTLGSFCVVDQQPRDWTPDELAILADLAAAAMTEIELHSQLAEQRKTEAALRASQHQWQAIITGAPVIVYVIDQNGCFTLSEGKGLEAIGIEPNYAVGKTIYEVFADQPDMLKHIHSALTGSSPAFITMQKTPLGDLHYEVRISPLYADDQQTITGAIGVATDVTERAVFEELLQELVEQLSTLRRVGVELSELLNLDNVLMIAMDTALRSTGANHGFIGLLDGDQVRAVHTAGSYAPNSRFDQNYGIIGRALRTKDSQFIEDLSTDPDCVNDIPNARAQMVIPLVHRERLIGLISLKTTHHEGFTREAFGFLTLLAGQITIAIDNAQLYQLSQSQLNEMHRLYLRVSELEQLKTDMIRIAAHDLRNPLGLVQGYADMLLEDAVTLSEDQIAFVQTILKGTQKMGKIIEDILSLQRIEAMPNHEARTPVDLTYLALDVFAGNEPRAQQKAQTYRLEQPDWAVQDCRRSSPTARGDRQSDQQCHQIHPGRRRDHGAGDPQRHQSGV